MHLPPLSTVRSFEATARHGSAARAAEELHVTPGAISQQLRKLEDFVGQRLFERQARGLVLTDAGRVLLAGCQEALAALQRATAQLRHQRQVLLVSCTPVFAAQWLVPRLQDFLQSAPEVDVHVSTTARLVDLAAEGVHFAVRHGLGRYAGLQARRLLDDDLQPVCSPLWVAHRPTAQAADITAAGLLHDGQRDDWQLWARAAGRPQLDTSQGIVFVDSNAAIEAALAGRGVALARRSMVVNELEQGRLLALQVPPLVTPLAYYLVFREPTLAQPAARRFHDWLLAQAALARTVDG
ncbi:MULTISPECIES: transcriptional regulator GcvA [Comamonas]|jgi:LysR family glycine cleavage system transcriptional activator|uniref:Transcriptional regulator GcvA n=1 Tax=Comamonas terrigena TaxID=32013 RepID=A0A2A7UTQ0_COMTR|nr:MULTISPECIES: transcriptional regulator GcvA [Comamonas]MBP7351735.1 transcriptional regulator GcvA [Comamonas sp.]MBD9532586.1 transcriptional regulator GcvA [Comamonas sp. CMM01]MDH1291984.1 transcriptional regulator GcvA [Comamonas terrigena]PEH88739.1 transcriptional regulator GcvA [Comamonas terrigena]SUY88434.1 Gcv operon activator [Comamonas terrigena]